MHENRPSLKQLGYFLAVVEYGSFRRAADELKVSQPTLTAQVARLEQLLGVQVFERSRQGAQLSPAGRFLLPGARRVMEEFEGLLEAANTAQHGAEGTYRLGVTPTLGPYLLPSLLPELHRRYAKLKLYVREDTPRRLEEGLQAGTYDLILTALPVNSPDLTVVPLLREYIRLVLPMDHPLAEREAVTADDLAGAQILTIENTHQFSRQIEHLCERFGAQVLRDYEGTSLDALRVMVVVGMGMAFLPALYISSEIREPSSLAVRELAGESISRVHALAWRPTAPSRNFFKTLVDELKEVLAGHSPADIEVLS